MATKPGLNQSDKPAVASAVPELDARWSLVLRVLTSRHFFKATQLRDILVYISRQSITDPGASIREYEIACGVLGRKPDFNPNEDNIVRVQVSHLRKKLKEYFTTEGKDEPVHITIPKRTYTARFEPKALAYQPVRPGRPFPNRRLWMAFGFVLTGVALGAAVTTAVSLRQNATKPAVDPVLSEAWAPFAGPNSNVLLSIATPLNLEMAPGGYKAYGTQTYPAPKEAYTWFRQHRPLAPAAKLGMFFTDNMVGVGAMNAVVTTVGLLRSLGSSYEILPERVATLASLRGRNAILFGAPTDSEAITRTMEHTPLVVDWDASVRDQVIRDRESGKILPPLKTADGEFTGVYGLITVLNNRDAERRLGMVVFSGIGSGGTQGAAEFFTSPRALRHLRGIFSREGVNGFPPAYQVVVKCTFSNLLVQSVEYYSHRILQK